ncbi:hypothetical protein ACO2Q7_06120 [Rathayibacter sp. KR2-224]|uniref:hypothetical protein n=1 Tax=Rathayibacter sp. KR2-224 TaxID=3400913 RepID=UPI003BFACB02
MAAMPEPTPEQAAEMNSAWNSWAQQVGDGLIDFGAPTAAVSTGADRSVGGYSLIEAQDADSVESLLTGHPHRAMGGTIDVYELTPVPGM